MCGLCGLFQTGAHWTDAPGGRSGMRVATRRQERLHRVALINRVLKHCGMKLADWGGHAYLLSNRTGQTQVVPDMAALWPTAETMAKHPLDPLDEAFIAALERELSEARN
jgi:hypothetical protein